MKRPIVIIESPFSGATLDEERANVEYARDAVRDSIRRRECPYASHLFFPQVLNDANPAERALGIALGMQWARFADFVAVYRDRGISEGMYAAIEKHLTAGLRIEYRSLRNDATKG